MERAAPRAQLSILVIDDDDGDGALCRRALQEIDCVAEVSLRTDPQTALRDLAEAVLRPDLILVDVNMPAFSGVRFLKAVGAVSGLNQTPVVMVTTSKAERDLRDARANGALGYVIKPEDIEGWRIVMQRITHATRCAMWSAMRPVFITQ